MLGKVTFSRAGVMRTATLQDDGRWTVVPPLPGPEGIEVGSVLASIVSLYGGPAHGPFGPHEVEEARTYLAAKYGAASYQLASRIPIGRGVAP